MAKKLRSLILSISVYLLLAAVSAPGVYSQSGALADPPDDSPVKANENQPVQPTIQLTESASSVVEDNGSVTISASITDPDGYAVSVEVAFQAGSSSSVSADFAGSVIKKITFPAGISDNVTESVSFDIIDDTDYEGTEQAVFQLVNLSTSGAARIGSSDTFELTIIDNDEPDVVINEILAAPDADVDGNGSTGGPSDDEFIEILNNETRAVDISGWTISDNGTDIKHTFASGTILPASGALVLFSKDDDGAPAGVFGGAIVQISDLSLALNDDGDIPTLEDTNGNLIDEYNYSSEGVVSQSLVRSPEGSGSFVKHGTVSGMSSSPGTRADGTNFTTSLTVQGKSGWRMLSAPVDGMAFADILDDIPIRGYANHNPAGDKNFYTGYDGAAFSAAGDLESGDLTPGKGFLLYFFDNQQAGSSHRPVTLDVTTGSAHTGDVNVSLHSTGDGWNLLGNPFETAIDISGIMSWANGGSIVGGVGQIWDNNSNSYILTTTNDDRIAAWQGFFIENRDATDIDIPASAKISGTQAYKEAGQKGYLALKLNGTNSSTGEKTSDKASVLYFHPEAGHEWDGFDASKLVPLTSRYAILSILSTRNNGRVAKAQDSRPYDFEGEISYDLQVETKEISGQFVLSWERENLPDTWTFTLTDNETGTRVDMNSVESYSFTYKSNDRPKSAAATNRSKMERSLPEAITVTPSSGEEPRFTVKVASRNRAQESREIPESVKLNQNYPNPFNPRTTVSFELTEQAEVALSVYTIVGQKVATLVDGSREAGVHREVWNAADMPSGIYIAQLEVNGKVFIRKMTLIK